VLLIAHREELLLQAEKTFRKYWPKVDIGYCKAERKELGHQIILGSTQTCCRSNNLRRLKEQGFNILMIDETHHAPADTYQSIIKELGFSAGTKKLLIGVTATPMRLDKKQLGDFFDKIVYSKNVAELIAAGYLSPISGRRILTSFNLNGICTRMGDFAVGELASTVNTKERNNFIVDKFKKHALNRKALVFCVDVKHCQDVAKTFNTQGIIAEAVWGEMDSTQRNRVLKAFSNGHIQVVTSCGILTEGFDEPSIQAIVMARPTKSKGFYIQMVGRGLRKHPGKETCLVLDFTDKYNNLNTIITLNKAIPEVPYIDISKVDQVNIDRKPKIKTLKDVDRKFDILGIHPNFFWINIGDDELSLTDDNKNTIVIKPKANGFVADFYTNEHIVNLCSTPLSLTNCIKFCEDYARKNLNITYADLNGPWLTNARYLNPTPKQIEILQNHRTYSHRMNKADATFKIQEIFARSAKENRIHGNMLSQAQRSYLEHFGIRADNLTKSEAFVMIQKLKQCERRERESFTQR
jgi:hypothetical protein